MLHHCLQLPYAVRQRKPKNPLGIHNLPEVSSQENHWSTSAMRSRVGGSMNSHCLLSGHRCCQALKFNTIPPFRLQTARVDTLAFDILGALVLGNSLNTKIHSAQIHHVKWIYGFKSCLDHLQWLIQCKYYVKGHCTIFLWVMIKCL